MSSPREHTRSAHASKVAERRTVVLKGLDKHVAMSSVCRVLENAGSLSEVQRVRKTAFATFSSFALNYLRRRRPLSSVAPLLYFCSWALVFSPAYVYLYSGLHLQHVVFLAFTCALTLILFRENRNEAKTIFVNEW